MEYYSSKELKRFNYLLGEIDAAYHEMSLKLGISDSAMKILYAICDSGESCLLQEIVRRCGLSKQTVNSSIRKLENEGIVYLENVSAKAKKVCLTDSGKNLANKTAFHVMALENSIFASWTPDEVQTYLNLTERFLNDVREKKNDL